MSMWKYDIYKANAKGLKFEKTLQKEIDLSLMEAGEAELGRNRVIIECKDLDETTIKGEVYHVLRSPLGILSV